MSSESAPAIVERQAKAPAHAKNPDRQSEFVRNAGRKADPMPGNYPVVMNLGNALDLIPEEFEIGFGNFVRAVESIFDTAVLDPSFEKLRYFRNLSEAAAVEYEQRLKRSFVSSGCMVLAQSLVGAHHCMFLTKGDTSAVYGPSLPHAIPVRQLASAFGEFEVGVLGRKYVLTDYTSVLKRIARAATSYGTQGDLAGCVSTFYFPVSDADRSLDWLLIQGTQKILSAHTTRPLLIPNLTAFPGQLPPVIDDVHGEAPYSADDYAALKWFFGNRPAGVNSWRVNQFDTLRSRALGVVRPANYPTGDEDYVSPTQMKEKFTAIVEEWNIHYELVGRWFKMADYKDMGDRFGSQSQTFQVEWQTTTVRATGLLHPGAKDLALAVVYPTTWAWAATRPLLPKDDDYTVVTSGSLSTLRTQWISRSLQSYAPPV